MTIQLIEKIFEGILWRNRYVVRFAVVASMAPRQPKTWS